MAEEENGATRADCGAAVKTISAAIALAVSRGMTPLSAFAPGFSGLTVTAPPAQSSSTAATPAVPLPAVAAPPPKVQRASGTIPTSATRAAIAMLAAQSTGYMDPTVCVPKTYDAATILGLPPRKSRLGNSTTRDRNGLGVLGDPEEHARAAKVAAAAAAAALGLDVNALATPSAPRRLIAPPQIAFEFVIGPDGKRRKVRAEGLTGGRWTFEEDEKLRQGVACIGAKNWKRISVEYLSYKRTDVQCLHRWQKALRPGLVKGRWTSDEDNTIVSCIAAGITKWSEIAEKIPGRIGKQCRERWFNQLDPSIKKGGWYVKR